MDDVLRLGGNTDELRMRVVADLLVKRQYRQYTGREQTSDVIAYQVRQSFKPGEVTAEEANRIGVEFAERFLKGKHAYIVCTHTDRRHIHNHILWNSTTLDCRGKFDNFWGSSRAVRALSDMKPSPFPAPSDDVRVYLTSMSLVQYSRAGAVDKRTLTDYVGTLDDEQLETVCFILQKHCGLFITEAVEAP